MCICMYIYIQGDTRSGAGERRPGDMQNGASRRADEDSNKQTAVSVSAVSVSVCLFVCLFV